MAVSSQNIILIGFMGVGKTTLAKKLAAKLHREWLDTDALIEKQAGCTISEIFAAQGEQGFRQIECAVLRSLQGTVEKVISTGGGIVLLEENRTLLPQLGQVIWLTASEAKIFERVSRNTKRPLLQTDDPRQTLHRLYLERQPHYASVAHSQIDTGVLSHRQSVENILASMQPMPATL